MVWDKVEDFGAGVNAEGAGDGVLAATTPLTLEDVCALRGPALRQLLAAGHPVDPTTLDDSLYRGVSLGVPQWFRKLTWTVFAKTFYRDPETGDLLGWNVRMKQQGIRGPLEPMTRRDGTPITFGHYGVTSCDGYGVPSWCDQGLLIQYRFGGNRRWDPVNLARDPLVAVNAGSSELLLGWSYLQLGGVVSTPSFFVLQREGAIPFVPQAPGRRVRALASSGR